MSPLKTRGEAKREEALSTYLMFSSGRAVPQISRVYQTLCPQKNPEGVTSLAVICEQK